MTSERPPHEQATVEAEHRFRARQVAVRQAESRRRRLIWGTIISVVVVGAVAIGSLYSPLLDGDSVDMRGLRHVEPAEVSEVTGLATGQQMIDLQVADIEAAVVDLPWVERASVVRRWPDTVEIRVTERSPIAIAVIGEQRVVVTEGGYVAGEATAIDAGLATVELVDADPAVVGEDLPGPIADAVALVGEMVGDVAVRAVRSTVSPNGVLEVELDGGVIVDFGTAADARQKILTVERVLAGAVDGDCIDRIDVSVPSPFTVSRRPGC